MKTNYNKIEQLGNCLKFVYYVIFWLGVYPSIKQGLFSKKTTNKRENRQ